jgi:ABC-type transport system involved in cytochrome c biogenesis permease subunit
VIASQEGIARVINRGRVLTVAGLLAVAGVYVLSLGYTPPERSQGLAFKILYVHAPSAWAMETAFVLVGLTGALYLWLRDERLDIFAEASATVGMVFGAVLLTTGPIWGRTIWGKWWAWDPRLTFTFPAIARSPLVVVAVSGAEKREPIARIRAGENLPAARIRASEVIWLVDRDAYG